MFPEKTLDWMIKKVENCIPTGPSYDESDFTHYEHLLFKLRQIKSFKDEDKKNRWFGYYQKLGEEYRIWDLDNIIKNVRYERWGREIEM